MSLISSKKQEIIKKIEENIVRTDIVDGVYGSATFTYGKNEFKVVADVYDEEGNRVGSCIYKNGETYRGSIVSNGRYRDISLYTGASLMEHQLLTVCLIPGASDKLLKEDENNVINHKTIERASKEARQAHIDDAKYWSECVVNGELDKYDKNKFFSKTYQPPCDVRDLEVCTSAENVAHGALIRVFSLYDYPISAKDVHLLKQYLINEKQVAYTMDLYMNSGADVMLSMLRG